VRTFFVLLSSDDMYWPQHDDLVTAFTHQARSFTLFVAFNGELLPLVKRN